MSEQKSLLKFVEIISKDPKDDREFVDGLREKYFNVGHRDSVSQIEGRIRDVELIFPWVEAGFRVIDIVASVKATGGLPPNIAMTSLYSPYNNTHSSFVYDGNGGGHFFSGNNVFSSSEGSLLDLPSGTLLPETPVGYIPRLFRKVVNDVKTGVPHASMMFSTEAPLVEKSRVKALEELSQKHPSLHMLPQLSPPAPYNSAYGTIGDDRDKIILAWEAHDWKAIPRPLVDPLLIRRLSRASHSFGQHHQYGAILSAWDITPVEHQFMRQLLEKGEKGPRE